MPDERGVVQALDRALTILDVLSFAEEDLELREVSARAGLPKSTAHRLLATLERRGHATQDPITGRYRAGLKTFRFLSFGHEVHNVLSRLASQSGETANLGSLHGTEVTYLARADSPHALRWQLRVGSRVPAHCSGMGKAILSHLDRHALTRLLPEVLPAYTEYTTPSRAALLHELDEVRQRGYALDNEEFMIGVRCIAVPLCEANGRVVGALSLAGPAFRFSEESARAQAPSLRAAANEIAGLLDYRPRPAAHVP